MNNQEQLNRMKAMMTYGLQTENKKNNFSSLEYNRLGADGKMYGIVREGTKYYIKVSENTKNLIKENFEYIGGFRNRKSNEYTSYANALKHFDLNMRSLNEAYGKGKKLVAESWNPEKQEFVMVEATQKMYDEIQRQRQIMANASIIFEGKDGSCSCGNCNTKKEGAKKGQYDLGTGSAENANGVGFEEDAPKKPEDMPNLYDQVKTNIHEADHGTLAWHKTGGGASETIGDTYLDTSKGTEIGDGAPFDGCPKGDAKKEMKNGTVEEETNLEECDGKSMAMDCGDNQNCPTPGVAEVGDDAPFDNKAKNGLQEAEEGEEPMDEDPMGGEEPMDDAPMGGEDEPVDGDVDLDSDIDDVDLEGDDMESEDADLEVSDESNEIESLRSEINSLKDLLASVAEKLGVSSESIADSEFNDDPLYDDSEIDDNSEIEGEGDDDFDFEIDSDDFEGDDLGFEDDTEMDGEDSEFEDDDDTEVFESRSYKRMKALNEDKLNYFGMHPAYRKQPVKLPTTGEDQNEHGHDWNDDSVYSESPYGEKIGSGAPFEVDPATIENAIAESIKRILGGKKNLK